MRRIAAPSPAQEIMTGNSCAGTAARKCFDANGQGEKLKRFTHGLSRQTLQTARNMPIPQHENPVNPVSVHAITNVPGMPAAAGSARRARIGPGHANGTRRDSRGQARMVAASRT